MKFSDILDVDVDYITNWVLYKIDKTRDFNIYNFEKDNFRDPVIEIVILFNESHGQHIIFVRNDIYKSIIENEKQIGPYDDSFWKDYIYIVDEGIYWTDRYIKGSDLKYSKCMIINNKDLVKWTLFSLYESIKK